MAKPIPRIGSRRNGRIGSRKSACGLPREIAIELFQTFLIRGLIRQHLASNIGVAKSQIQEKEPIVWEILQEVMRGHPVLLNRAPTLHRLGIQALLPAPPVDPQERYLHLKRCNKEWVSISTLLNRMPNTQGLRGLLSSKDYEKNTSTQKEQFNSINQTT